MTYPADMDKECIKLCDAINSIPGLVTVESCCGHGERPFRIYFRVNDPRFFATLLYVLDS